MIEFDAASSSPAFGWHAALIASEHHAASGMPDSSVRHDIATIPTISMPPTTRAKLNANNE